MNTLRVGCLQINSTSNVEENLEKVNYYCQVAKEKGIKLLVTPENVCYMPVTDVKTFSEESAHLGLKRFKEFASIYKIWLLLGSTTVKDKDGSIYNRSYLIDDTGCVVAHYDKIHLFDVKLSDGEAYRESDVFRRGEKATLVNTTLGSFGMTICYDLRFPYLFRDLAQHGAVCIFVPAAFTKTTGEAHWEHLLRARAIENGCFILAANQCGLHSDGRETFGHSLIVSPWGTIMAFISDEEGVIFADLNLSEVSDTRSKIPSLENIPYVMQSL